MTAYEGGQGHLSISTSMQAFVLKGLSDCCIYIMYDWVRTTSSNLDGVALPVIYIRTSPDSL
jgi:hypothetical protein